MRLLLLSLMVLLSVVRSRAGDYDYDDYYDSHEHHDDDYHDSHEHHDDDYHDDDHHDDDHHDDDHHDDDYYDDYDHHQDFKSSKKMRYPPEGPPHPKACADKLQ